MDNKRQPKIDVPGCRLFLVNCHGFGKILLIFPNYLNANSAKPVGEKFTAIYELSEKVKRRTGASNAEIEKRKPDDLTHVIPAHKQNGVGGDANQQQKPVISAPQVAYRPRLP